MSELSSKPSHKITKDTEEHEKQTHQKATTDAFTEHERN